MEKIDLKSYNSLSPTAVNARTIASALRITKPTDIVFPDGTIKRIEGNGYIVKYSDGGFAVMSAREFERLYKT